MDPTMPPPPPRNPSSSSSSSMPPPPPPPPAQPEASSTPDAPMAEADGSTNPNPSPSSSSMPPPPPPRPSPPSASESAAPTDGTADPSPSVSGSSAEEAGDPGGDTEMADADAPPEQRQQRPRPRPPYAVPEWSAAPGHPFFLEVIKSGQSFQKLDVSKKGAYMFGRVDLCDFVLEHPTISRFHAVLQFRNDGEVFLYDLGSTHGSSINKTQIKKKIYTKIHVGDIIRFGQSSRLYLFQGPSELMPPEKYMQKRRDARIRQDMLDREASLARAKTQAALAEGISWGMSEDAPEELGEDEADEITWQTYTGQLTDRQQKTRGKIIKRMEKFSLRNHLAVMVPCLAIGPKFTMANRMKEMREELEEVTRQHNKFELVPGTNVDELKLLLDDRETSSTIQASIVGRTKEEDKIWASLSESITEDVTVLAIYGIGGLGKSTLAQMVYNNISRFEDYTRVWIYVSQTLDLNKIGNSVITQLSENENESHYTDRQMINSTLAKRLAGKKIMIVLDDLWEENKVNLDGLIAMFKVGKGSKVVVLATTRNEEIARQISTICPHKLASLTDEMCWTIIKQKSDFESRDDKEQLRHIGEHIAAKCRGVALAAQSLGHMLQDMSYHEWVSVRDSDIWTVSASASDPKDAAAAQVFASLRLSYSFMPVYLKLCFAYCAIFPKGWKIYKDDLIHQWISLGFIEATKTFSTWELGERYIRQLLKLSFLECSKDSTTARGHPDDVTSFTMHDLVHDLASAVMGDEILLADKHGNSGGSCCHYALLSDCSKPLDSPRIRALCFMDSTAIGLNDAVFSSAKSLRVLELKQCSIHNLPDSIGWFKQLRYLNAPRVQNTVIPNSISSLTKVIYLSLRGSSAILALPESVGEMEGLNYLDLSGCSGIRELPESFGELRKLMHLDLSSCSSLENISKFLGNLTGVKYLNLSECACIGDLPASLGSLSELQYLNLSFSSYVCGCTEAEVLSALTKLEYLNLSSWDSSLKQLPEGVANFVHLKYLILSGCGVKELPRLFGNLKCLVHLDLSRCDRVKFLPEAFDGLTNLQYLNLLGCFRATSLEEIKRIIDRISTLSNLEHLDLSNNIRIFSLPESLGNLRKLQTLDISNTHVEKIPASIGAIASLKMLLYSGCFFIKEVPQFCYSSITLPHFVVHAGDGESSSNLVLLRSTNPDELEISRLENVKSVEEAEHIKLMEKDRLTYSLKLQWTVGAERFVDDAMLLAKLAPPSMIKRLEIRGYNGVSIPAWVSQLPNLKLLILSGMESLEEWSTSDSSGGNDLIFPVIEELVIKDCPKLRMKSFLPRAIKLKIEKSDNVLSSWGEISTSSSSSPVTAELHVSDSELPLHQWRLIRHLPGLTTLWIARCGDMTISSDIIRHLSSIEKLCLVGTDKEDLPTWLGELTSLKSLSIQGYTGEKELDENIRKPTKLQSLYLLNCASMSSLPHWLIELTCLEHLRIHYGHGLKSLPEGIQQLSNLKELYISSCPDLVKWCTSEENETKLAHIEDKRYL